MPSTIVDDHGAIYIESTQEQTAYCQCLGLCPKSRTAMEEIALEKGWITTDGFVEKIGHRQSLSMSQCHFNSNPLLFLRKLIELRNNTHTPIRSHVGCIIFKQSVKTTSFHFQLIQLKFIILLHMRVIVIILFLFIVLNLAK